MASIQFVSCTSEALTHFSVSQYRGLPTGEVSKSIIAHDCGFMRLQTVDLSQSKNQRNNQLFMPLDMNCCFINY